MECLIRPLGLIYNGRKFKCPVHAGVNEETVDIEPRYSNILRSHALSSRTLNVYDVIFIPVFKTTLILVIYKVNSKISRNDKFFIKFFL